MSSLRVSPSLALCAYAETWISGAKVIVFGDALSPLPERLVERGARLVQVYDSDPARVAEAEALEHSRQIAYAPLEAVGGVARDGVFEFGIIEELIGPKANAELPLGALRRALGKRGMALVAARNPEIARSLVPASDAGEPLSYYDLYELVSQHFEEVRMLGQTAFVGYAVADFGAAEDADVRLDTSFVPGGAEEPEWFLALVSSLPASPEAFSVIQLPLGDLPLGGADREELVRLERELSRTEEQLAELQRSKAVRDAVKEPRETPHQKAQLEAVQAELAKREQWLAGLESRAATADQRADEMQAELDQLSSQSAKTKDELSRAKDELSRARDELVRAKDEAVRAKDEVARTRDEVGKSRDEVGRQQRRAEDEVRARRGLDEQTGALQREVEKLTRSVDTSARHSAELERRAQTLNQRITELTAELAKSERARQQAVEAGSAETQAELQQLEAQLVERGAEVSRLMQALEQTERFGRQLIGKLTELEAAAGKSRQGAELESLARRNAELEADLEAARWTLSSLGANAVAGSISATSALGTGAGSSPRRDENSRGGVPGALGEG